MIGTDGKIKETTSDKQRISHALITKQDITGKLVNEDGTEGKDFTIPSGSTVLLKTFDSKGKKINITVMSDKGAAETIRVSYDDSDYPSKLNGVDEKELFLGMTFAG